MALPQPTVIPVQQDSSCLDNEWSLLELNGELIMPVDLPNEKKPLTTVFGPDQIELGSLCFQDDKPVLILGTHELVGRMETLKQPFCVFEKVYGDEGDNPQLEYKVAGIIKHKMLFNNYPKTIMKS
ncbi:CTF8, chromosome transmission fidelity factor 8 homolog (Saccharomyces cerevisiae) [Seminavis robusta]|uniref:CTF8, chromosome transmission fidelity factor 8 homolog (Saccharomyces cerevisiae) n=1 Tax=Seminavis robusta TaxID=568900 RepID=A0A9N8EG26_9STRA|nr:CTF8, chromosome transmission fidelity factor 8 homolog (Saccharomyces cerevisiae) [Seminavis robusta]|eukprot:Sro1136_g245170.1 CTF8, chromosome transmission fidelity factor 8 homolog (Saccharomyces cerevisiae) (126) ;mRNA; f:18092-18469